MGKARYDVKVEHFTAKEHLEEVLDDINQVLSCIDHSKRECESIRQDVNIAKEMVERISKGQGDIPKEGGLVITELKKSIDILKKDEKPLRNGAVGFITNIQLRLERIYERLKNRGIW
ncbi:MAG: hypothetical protein KJ709_00650 [Nanoarchaeota archaeon]|nr:hypothetical protein [Nanoarchaeota archaeon]